ncbi:putative protein N(5)-glutamine methyltransferase [Geodermatophilus ruber]|uniref:peptide chain release factor N(5)-glutamine methyltransferase n=1 Tax=Geodermatophilus ruber TaxID=504800 RepID=A0A1I3Z627_9ACTN|nr:putative protein N(5)-glutamine methyltransferase [Geodermatophilus ruber]SFK39604.1 release factor glutamine methyltransferase [Geodermatophilus ruber]
MSAPPSPAVRADVVTRLRGAGCVFAEDEAELLLATAATPAELDTLVARRVAGEPLELIVGWAEFCGLRIAVAPGVFVPRRRTGFLVGRAAALLRGAGSPVVVDLCCGTGAVGVALATAVGGAELHAADIDPVAVRCARANVAAVGGRVYAGDLYDALPEPLAGRVDVVVANAPYVPAAEIPLMPPEARDHEPRTALDGGADGLDVQRRVATGALRWLTPGGALLIETSARQAPRTRDAVIAGGLRAEIARSADLDATVVIGRSPDH